MIMVQAIVRPERVGHVMEELINAGFSAVTKISVLGRGKQRGLKMGDIYYDEIPKEMIIIVVERANKDKVVDIIMKSAKYSKKGAYGDGKIFLVPVEEAYTISNESDML